MDRSNQRRLTSAPGVGSEYRLGRRQVPVDVIRPRTRVVSSIRPISSQVFVNADAVPEKVERDAETTQPVACGTSGEPGHQELCALAEGKRGPLVLAGRYRLDRCVGRGGMATVFSGELISLGRPVAVKILDDEGGHRHDGLERFLREARTMAQIRQRNVIDVIDLGSTAAGVVYMVMELLEGEDLQDLLQREQRVPWALVRELMTEICDGLEAAHCAGVVHRDLKPANCFRSADGVKLLDFGIAARRGAPSSSADEQRDERRLTFAGQVIGTPEYMSPEQARGEVVDVRSDVYAAGILMGELLTGRVPFEGKTATAVLDAQIHESPRTLAELAGAVIEIDAAIEAIYTKALAKDPAERFATITELRAAIVAAEPDSMQPRWWKSWQVAAAA